MNKHTRPHLHPEIANAGKKKDIYRFSSPQFPSGDQVGVLDRVITSALFIRQFVSHSKNCVLLLPVYRCVHVLHLTLSK